MSEQEKPQEAITPPPVQNVTAPAVKPTSSAPLGNRQGGQGRGGYGGQGQNFGRGGPGGGRGGPQGRGGPGGGRGGQGGRRGDRKEPSEFTEEVIQISRVTRVVKGGRRMRFRATVAVGNKKGKIGVGTGKSVEVSAAIQKAITQAKKNFFVCILENDTIPHEVRHKFKRAEIILIPAAAGTGLKAGGSVRKVLELAGVTNILSKMIGCRNRLTNAYATIEILKKLRPHKKS
ncbi:MAG: 30S ribosomal protein S5 [Patescibacteria group bacterium]